nr:Gag-Pol polyprotein [Tanacetum cinerariifolium]
MQTQTSNTLHNAIMEAGSKDRPPMLAPGSLITKTKRIHETYKNVSQEIRDQLNAEAEAVQIILTGIDNDIYSTVDACPNACEMWKAIERLKQGELINVQDLETNLYWEFGKFTSQDGESLDSYYSRFYKMMNELIRNQCKVTNHQVNVQFLLQLQPEWQRCLNEEMVADLRYFNSLELEVDSLISQLETQKIQFLNEIDRPSLLKKCEGLETELSKSKMIPQLKSNPMGDSVMRNNSQGKKQEVEDQSRNVKLSKNKTSVTACNDSLNAKTLNVKSVFAMCDKCVFIDKHDMCILNSVAQPIKKTVASESNQKPRNFTRKLYERVSKTCSWWYSKFTPSGIEEQSSPPDTFRQKPKQPSRHF